MTKKRILIVNQEISPYLPDTPNARLGCELPHALSNKGCEVRTFMPKFGSINERRNQLHEVIRLSGMNISINDADHPLIIKVASLQPARIQVYFMDNDDYFQKQESDVDPLGSNRSDNDERAIFYARSSMETVKKLRWDPAVIQCQGWFSAFVPMYLKKMYTAEPSLRKCKIIYAVLDGTPKASSETGFIAKLKADGISDSILKEFKNAEFSADILHKMAIKSSDAIVIATKNISDDLKDYIKKSGLPVLDYEKIENNLDAYKDFYDSLEEEN